MHKPPELFLIPKTTNVPSITEEEAIYKLRQDLFEIKDHFVYSRINEQILAEIKHTIQSKLIQYCAEYSLKTNCIDITVIQRHIIDSYTGELIPTNGVDVMFNCNKGLLSNQQCPWCIMRRLICTIQ